MSASSPCTSLTCSLIIALKEPVNKVLEASLKKRAQAQHCLPSRRLLWESPRHYEQTCETSKSLARPNRHLLLLTDFHLSLWYCTINALSCGRHSLWLYAWKLAFSTISDCLERQGKEKGTLVTLELPAHDAIAVCRKPCYFFLVFSPDLPPKPPSLSKLETVGPQDTSAQLNLPSQPWEALDPRSTNLPTPSKSRYLH